MDSSRTERKELPLATPERGAPASSGVRWARGSIVLGEPLSPDALRDDTLVSVTRPSDDDTARVTQRVRHLQSTVRTFSLPSFIGFVVVGFALGSVISGEANLLLSGMLRAAIFVALVNFSWKFLDAVRTGELHVRDLIRRRNLSSSAARWMAHARQWREVLAKRLAR